MCDGNEINEEIECFLRLHDSNFSKGTESLRRLKILRNLCAKGIHNQEAICRNIDLQILLHKLIFEKNNDPLKLMALQLLANAIVKNRNGQIVIWQNHGEAILKICAVPPLGSHTNVFVMIIYNVFNGGSETTQNLLPKQQVMLAIVRIWQTILAERNTMSFDFLHFLFERFLVQDGRDTVRCYDLYLDSSERVAFLDYLANYLRNDSPNGHVHSFILQHISKEFKVKSDCVLRNKDLNTQQANIGGAQEVHALLRVIASVTGSEYYATLYSTDHSLFLNVSSLLRCLVAVGKESKNIFTPMNKLEEVAPTSNISLEFESLLSFELKTLLVRTIANLLYKNRKNQHYCLDTQLIPTLLECTIIDARNPMMKEWSILAIRNACIDCPQIQNLIANLSNQGPAQNDILTELNLELGSLRIKPNKD